MSNESPAVILYDASSNPMAVLDGEVVTPPSRPGIFAMGHDGAAAKVLAVNGFGELSAEATVRDSASGSSAHVSHFGALKTSPAYPVLRANFPGPSLNAEVWTEEVATGSAAIAFEKGAGRITTGTTPSSQYRIQSVRSGIFEAGQVTVYQAGVNPLTAMTAGNTRRWGLRSSDGQQGLYFEILGAAFGVVALRDGVATRVEASAFNKDATLLDPTGQNRTYRIEYSAGQARFYATQNEGEKRYLHRFADSAFPLVSDLDLGLFFENANDGATSTDVELRVRGASSSLWGHVPVSRADEQISAGDVATLTKAIAVGRDPVGNFVDQRASGRDLQNSTTTPLAGSSVYRGTWTEWSAEGYSGGAISVASDVPGAMSVELSQEEAPVDGDDSSVDDVIFSAAYTPGGVFRRRITAQARWFRVKYENGIQAQTEFVLDTVLYTAASTSVALPLGEEPTLNMLAEPAHALLTAELESAPDTYDKVRQSTNAEIGKNGLNVSIVNVEDAISLKAYEHATARQFVAGATPVRIDLAAVGGKRRKVVIQTRGSGWSAIGFSDQITFESSSALIPPDGSKELELDQSVGIWAISEQVGGITNTQQISGTTAAGSVSSPEKALVSDDDRASVLTNGNDIRISGFTYAPTPGSSVSGVRILVEGRRNPTSGGTGVALQTANGSQNSSNTVSTSSLSAGGGNTILAAICRNDANSVTSVTGLGLTWTPVLQNIQTGGRRLDVWRAAGVSSGGAVTATMSTATRVLISATRFAGILASDPVEASGTTQNSDANVIGPNLSGSDKGIHYLATSHEAASVTPGTGYTERSDATIGTGSNTVSLHTQTKALTATASEQATATLASSSEWATIGVTLRPIPPGQAVVSV
ncbi:MAG: hypothetical protein R3268_05815, partial [Acidiferrobacterales bacterium]|nr:hypothetical protein [Acidiferrobacterales bacterium]